LNYNILDADGDNIGQVRV